MGSCAMRALLLTRQSFLTSMDGVVTALRYDEKENKFIVMVKYIDMSNNIQEIALIVADGWVLDTYGKWIMRKLIDRAENNRFLLPPKNAQGSLPIIKINEDKVVRLKYVPDIYDHVTDEDGKVHKTNKIRRQVRWRAMLESGQISEVNEEFALKNFGEKFKDECKRLGNKQCANSCWILLIVSPFFGSKLMACRSPNGKVPTG